MFSHYVFYTSLCHSFLLLFLITLTVFRNTGQVFCKIPLSLDFSDVFFVSRLGLWIWRKKLPLSLQISVLATNMIYLL